MRAFIFDKYGYYPPNEDDTSFQVEGWTFHLELVTKTEEELVSLDEFLQSINRLFPLSGTRIVKNRDGQSLSKADYGNLVLVATKDYDFTLNDLTKLHLNCMPLINDITYKISDTIKLWSEKIDLIEEKIVPSLKIDDYAYIIAMEAVIHGLGLAENAIQYLSEARIDFNEQIPNLTVVHRRLGNLKSDIFLDPFNLLIDSPMRDIAELYKVGYLDINQLLSELKKYQVTTFDATYLLARVLYPSILFDMLEDHYTIRKDIRSHIISYHSEIKKKMEKVKQLHQALVNIYSIRPISWLNK